MIFASFFIIAVVGCFAFELTEAVTVDSYSFLINSFPYRSAFGFNQPSYIDTYTNEQLELMARTYNLGLSDLYQLFGIVDAHTHLSAAEDLAIVDRITGAFDKELMRRRGYGYYHGYYGNPFSYGNRYMYPYSGYASYTSRSSYSYASTVLGKREPQLMTAAIRDTISNVSAGYNNMVNMFDYYLPNISNVLSNDIDDILYDSLPSMPTSEINSLSNSLSSNLRSLMSSML